MAKNDFDIDFDFEKEYGFDPNADLNSEFDAADLDLSEFDVNDLGIDLGEESDAAEDFSDFDVASLDLKDDGSFDLGFDFDEKATAAPVQNPEEEDFSGADDFGGEEDYDMDFAEDDGGADDFTEDDFSDAEFGEDDFDEEPDYADDDFRVMDFSRRASFFEQAEQEAADRHYETGGDQPGPDLPQDAYEENEPRQGYEPEEPVTDYAAQEEEKPDLKEISRRRRLSRRARKEEMEEEDGAEQRAPREPIQFTIPPVLLKLWKLYIPDKEMLNPEPDPNNPRRRRRKSKLQIFKEAYLPAVLACLTLILVLSFVIGSIGNAVKQRKLDADAARESSISAANQEEMVKSEAEMLLAQAEILAQGYDYDGAITLLETFSGNIADYEELVTAKSNYVTMRDSLIEYNNPSTIPNLSFHVLIHDPARAYADKDYGGLYNRNFVTTEEFQRILDQLYKNNFVLVDYDSFVSSNSDLEGNANFFAVPIRLPDGKKPVMITETMVNYFAYMIDSNKDGTADAGGAGFASKLVVDASGDIKAEYVDINSQTHIGNYDLVPILEDFIKAHPDFSYQGARATLAVTGEEGVFGYRTNTSYIASVSNEYYEKEVIAAKEVVQALRNKGYRIACYTYKNENYNQLNANLIQADLTKWNEQITPILGQVDTIVFAKESDIKDYSGPKFNVLYTSGFRIMVTNSDTPYAEVNNTYVRQSRLMVTGNTMAWKSAQFTNLGLFDPNIVLDMTNRKQVPN